MPDDLEVEARLTLVKNEHLSICKWIHPSRCIVLPKLRTPQVGITMRSLTHNLALLLPAEIAPRWEHWNTGLTGARTLKYLNILLIPRPFVLSPKNFVESPRQTTPNKRHAYFSSRLSSSNEEELLQFTEQVVERAKETIADVDAVVFPEASVPVGFVLKAARRLKLLVLGGEACSRNGGQAAINRAAGAAPWVETSKFTEFSQDKHHRWHLDEYQIRRYHLGSVFHPSRSWWEDIQVSDRKIHFVTLDGWLTFCALICEDLARQDPLADALRSVGPNLIIALLMDGPQLPHRWSAQYATTLADDPGSSVLTLTSLGMALLSRLPGKPPSRVIASWKDALTKEHIPIEMERDACAVLLSLTAVERSEDNEELTADGRSDRGVGRHLALSGIQQIVDSKLIEHPGTLQ